MGLCGWSHQRNQISLKAWLADLPTVGRKYSHVSTGASSTTLNQLAADVDSGCTKRGEEPRDVAGSDCFLCCDTVCAGRTLDQTHTEPTRDGAAQHHRGGVALVVGFKRRGASF